MEKSKYFERTPIDPASPQSCWDKMRGFGGQLGRVSERAMLTVVGLSSLARRIVTFLGGQQPSRALSQGDWTPTATVPDHRR